MSSTETSKIDGVPATDSKIPRFEKLAFNKKETRNLLGGVSATTLWRWEIKGLLKPIPGLGGIKLYSRAEIERFLIGDQKAGQN